MGYPVLTLFRFHPPDEEEIINRLLNKKRLDCDSSVQISKKHTAECVTYGFHSTYSLLHKVEGQQLPSLDSTNHVAENIRQGVEYEQVTDHIMTCNVEIMLQKTYASVHGKNCNYYQVIILASDSRNHVAEKIKKNISGGRISIIKSLFYFQYEKSCCRKCFSKGRTSTVTKSPFGLAL